jgi:membrane-associated phospholipid phosphatase
MTTALRVLAVSLLALIVLSTSSYADDNRFARAASDSIAPFLIVGEAALLSEGKQQAVQGAKSLLYTTLETQLLKATVREKRPSGNSNGSFPSGHTSAAFAMATCLADYKPKLAIPAYAVATTIAWSRVELDAHRWTDVIAGAALGYYTAKHFTKTHLSVSTDGVDYSLKW